MENLLSPSKIPLYLLLGFFAITFLQSAADKAMDWKGNLSFLNGHFKNSPLAKVVAPMLGTLTVVEFISGLACVYVIIQMCFTGSTEHVSCALTICGINLLMLLVGQRLAKDYAGAASVGNYLILVLLGFVLL